MVKTKEKEDEKVLFSDPARGRKKVKSEKE